MDAYFPILEDMQALSELVLVFVGFGLGLGACIWALGLLVGFIVNVFREV